MKKILLLIIVVAAVQLNNANAQNAAAGEKTFKATCSACHTVGKGKIIGPDLINVNTRRNEKWLISFIRSSQTVLKSGDPVAVKLFNDHNKIPMPDQKLTDAQIKEVLAFIKSKSTPAAGQKP